MLAVIDSTKANATKVFDTETCFIHTFTDDRFESFRQAYHPMDRPDWSFICNLHRTICKHQVMGSDSAMRETIWSAFKKVAEISNRFKLPDVDLSKLQMTIMPFRDVTFIILRSGPLDVENDVAAMYAVSPEGFVFFEPRPYLTFGYGLPAKKGDLYVFKCISHSDILASTMYFVTNRLVVVRQVTEGSGGCHKQSASDFWC